MVVEHFENWIDLSKAEIERTYIFKDGELKITEPHKILIHEDGRHVLTNISGNTINIPGQWLAFKSVSTKGGFSFNVVAKDSKNDTQSAWNEIPTQVVSITYEYDEALISVNNPSKILKKDSGSHKIIDCDGMLYYFRSGFVRITEETNELAAQ